MNFYNGTIDAIKESGHTVTDVIFVGMVDGSEGMDWTTFVNCSQFDYDAGYSGAEIPEDLIVQFSDLSWLERSEYDGSEWWRYVKTLPKYDPKMSRSVEIVKMVSEGGWITGYKLTHIQPNIERG